jgi:hypothetical protein
MGKSSVAEAIATAYLQAGVECIVLETIYTGRKWTGCTVVRDVDEFIELTKTKYDCALFVEEYARALDSKYKEGDTDAVRRAKQNAIEQQMIVLATTTCSHQVGERGIGHVVHFSCHRLVQFDVTLRDQCPELYLFVCRADDADELAKDYGRRDSILRQGPELMPGEFFHVEPGEEPEKLEIDFATLEIREVRGKRSWKPEAQEGA